MSSDGMNYAPVGKAQPVVKPGDFNFAVMALDHGHINGQTNGLREAGGTCKWVWDSDPKRAEEFSKKYECKVARSKAEILDDKEVRLVAAAAIPCDRGPLGMEVMKAGKDYFTDKTPFTSLEQLENARKVTRETGRKYMVYFSERLHVEAAVYAGHLVQQGAIGRVFNVIGLGPHRLSASSRPDWFFKKAQYGGILTDIGSHQCEQFLFFTGAKGGVVESARVANYHNPQYPELEDYGDASVTGDNGATFHYRVDWMTPDGLGTWGDGRAFLMGSEGYIELRKYIDVARQKSGDHLYLVDKKGEHYIDCKGKTGFPFFGSLILDCLNRTENAMTQEHAFMAAELCLKCQAKAVKVS
jgi:predicted dehydrogenase